MILIGYGPRAHCFLMELMTRSMSFRKREERFHLNALKFLESYCADCFKIVKIKNNGDGTADVTVRITHPFDGHPEYTGFDVKGIIMFNGSFQTNLDADHLYPYHKPIRVSWKLLGDPELLNPDGYTPRWNPDWHEEKSDLPMFNYCPGKHSNGTPTANLNGFLNFYTDENRHMFRTGKYVERTYHLWIPPGPLVAGYAVDACWEPPTVTPVTDPANDFPYSANQSEPYYFKNIINKGQVIDYKPCCTKFCDNFWFEAKLWYGKINDWVFIMGSPWGTNDEGAWPCSNWPNAPQQGADSYSTDVIDAVTDMWPNGYYRKLMLVYYNDVSNPKIAYDVMDFTIDIK